jgi:hypothetical protein
MPTTLVLAFNQPLDPALAQDVHEYQLIGPRGRIDPINSAVYDPATMTVTLHPKSRVNFHKTYRLIVDGASPSGLADTQGLLLNSTPTQPGSNYVGKLDWHNLVWPDLRRKTTRRDRTAIVARPASNLDRPGTRGVRLCSRALSLPAAGADHAPSPPRLRMARVRALAKNLPRLTSHSMI